MAGQKAVNRNVDPGWIMQTDFFRNEWHKRLQLDVL